MTERAYLAKVRYPSTLLRNVLAQPRPTTDVDRRRTVTLRSARLRAGSLKFEKPLPAVAR
jgi:hypothetical protein